MGLTIFHGTFPDVSHIQIECGKHLGMLCEISPVPHSTVMDVNNVMKSKFERSMFDWHLVHHLINLKCNVKLNAPIRTVDDMDVFSFFFFHKTVRTMLIDLTCPLAPT